MKNFNPKVSIIIPVYNGSNFLKEAIDSALAQTYKNIEIIVVNDGSNDNGATEEMAKSYGNKIRYYSKENGGVATALNLGIKNMTGDYFSWLSHDDMYYKNKIEIQIQFLKKIKNKKIILYSNYDLMDENSKFIRKTTLDHEMLENVQIYALLRGSVNGITLLIPKTAFDDYGEFDAKLRCTQDYDAWYRMIKTYRFVHLKDTLSITRIHSLQDTQSNPLVVSEGNVLWIKMVSSLSDAAKTEAAGNLFEFYLDMIRFLKQTPYVGALEYCRNRLEQSIQNKNVVGVYLNSYERIIISYEELAKEGEKRAAAYFLESAVKKLVADDQTKGLLIILKKLVGGEAILDDEGIIKQYLPKISKKIKPRLMFCSGHWLTGGMERVMTIIFDQLKDDYDLFLLTAYDGRMGKIEIPNYVTHLRISNHLFYDNYDQIALSFALIFDIDVVVGFMNLFNGQLNFYELCGGTRIKTIASNHEMYFYPYHNPFYYDLIQKRIDIFKKVDAALWLTNFSAAAYGLLAGNSYLMPNPNTYSVQEAVNNHKEKIILCVGRFNDLIKRIDRVLLCFSLVLKIHPDARLVLVGKYDKTAPIWPNDETTINDFLNRYKITDDKVAFVGEVNNVETYYAKATVLLLTSTSEGFGMVINEAASFGVPTVANKIPGLEDLISDGKNGFLTEQDDIESMAQYVDNILSDEKLYLRLSSNAHEMVKKFDREDIGNTWKFLIDTILEDMPDSNSKLRNKLGYKVEDYEKFSLILASELNKVIDVNFNERNELINYGTGSMSVFIARRMRQDYQKLIKAVETKGVRKTSSLLVKKTYQTAKRLYRRK